MESIYSTFIISKIKNEYQIKVGAGYVCQKDNEVSICDKEDNWTITQETI
jgi:hypothetical protein